MKIEFLFYLKMREKIKKIFVLFYILTPVRFVADIRTVREQSHYTDVKKVRSWYNNNEKYPVSDRLSVSPYHSSLCKNVHTRVIFGLQREITKRSFSLLTFLQRDATRNDYLLFIRYLEFDHTFIFFIRERFIALS